MWKNLLFLLSLLVISRFIGLPANFSPLLALAIFMPRLTDDKRIQHLLPVSIMAFTNLFLDSVNGFILTTMLIVFAVAPFVSRYTQSIVWGSVSAIAIWHIVVNGAVWFSGGGSLLQTYIAAIPFDFKLALSTWLYLALFHFAERLMMTVGQSNTKLFDRIV